MDEVAPTSAPTKAPKFTTAPVSRNIPSASSGRSSYVDTKLSPEERDIARRSFTASDMTDAQKEYEYWRNREKMRAMRRAGTLNE
jgi:hypothetical protein